MSEGVEGARVLQGGKRSALCTAKGQQEKRDDEMKLGILARRHAYLPSKWEKDDTGFIPPKGLTRS